MAVKRIYRVLLAKPGLDGHERGIKLVAVALMNAGMEVVYTGLHQTPAMIVNTALEEDVDLIGLSTMVGAHVEFLREIVELLESADAKDILVVVGGIIPDEDKEVLKSIGAVEIFTPGTPLREIVQRLIDLLEKKSLGYEALTLFKKGK